MKQLRKVARFSVGDGGRHDGGGSAAPPTGSHDDPSHRGRRKSSKVRPSATESKVIHVVSSALNVKDWTVTSPPKAVSRKGNGSRRGSAASAKGMGLGTAGADTAAGGGGKDAEHSSGRRPPSRIVHVEPERQKRVHLEVARWSYRSKTQSPKDLQLL